jgi:hypothetical protein
MELADDLSKAAARALSSSPSTMRPVH